MFLLPSVSYHKAEFNSTITAIQSLSRLFACLLANIFLPSAGHPASPYSKGLFVFDLFAVLFQLYGLHNSERDDGLMSQSVND